MNGEAIATDYAGTAGVKHSVEVQAGNTITVVAEFTILSTSSYIGKVQLTGTGQINIEAHIEDAPTRVFSQYTEGTGAIGGWEKSELRTYCKETLKPLMPENIRAGVKTVLKSQTAYQNNGTTSGSFFTQTTEDDIWIPSIDELFAESGATNSQKYKNVFTNDTSRIKINISTEKASQWITRAAPINISYCTCVSTTGKRTSGNWNNKYGVALGFCT